MTPIPYRSEKIFAFVLFDDLQSCKDFKLWFYKPSKDSMNFLKLLGLQKMKKGHPNQDEDILHLWEDDYLMIELIPKENIDFVKNETKRINNFGEEHFDGTDFNNITQIGKKPIATIEKLIDIAELEEIMRQCGLDRVRKYYMQDIGLLEGDKAPLGFGTNSFAVIFENEGRLVKEIWITGQISNGKDHHKVANALLLLGKEYDLIAVNWFKCEYYDLIERISVEEFVESISDQVS